MNLKCTYCSKQLTDKDTVTWKRKKHRKPKHRIMVPYHEACWGRVERLTNHSKWNVSNPLGGLR